jgi:hypothetical protein
MKTIPSDYKDRCLTIADIPKRSPESLSKIKVRINYDGETNGLHAEALDHYVLPLFEIAPKLLAIVAKDLPDWLNRFTPEENTLLMKLADTPRYEIRTGFKGEMKTIWGPSTNLPEGMSFRGVSAGDIMVQIKTAGETTLAYSDGGNWVPADKGE